VKTAAASAAASKEELRARIEKLERANATLRVKNKELRVAFVESSEQVDSLTLRIESLERRAQRQARQDAGAPAGSGRKSRSAPAGNSGRGRQSAHASDVHEEESEDSSDDAEAEPAEV
jgi:hypothetical protein